MSNENNTTWEADVNWEADVIIKRSCQNLKPKQTDLSRYIMGSVIAYDIILHDIQQSNFELNKTHPKLKQEISGL